MTLSHLIKKIVTTGLLLTTSLAAQENISLPKIQNEYDEFARHVLMEVFAQSQVSFKAREYDRALSRFGLVESLRYQDIDVAWLPANDALQNDFIAVELPVFKGALSYYQMHSNDLETHQLSTINLADLKRKRIGIVRRDANLAELSKAGFVVAGARDDKSLKSMLEGDRFDLALTPLFGETQIADNWDPKRPSPPIVFASNPHFFAVHQSRPELARAIQIGLESMYQDGSMESYMKSLPWVVNVLNKLESEQLQVLEIDKPGKRFAAMSDDAPYWLHPNSTPLLGALLTD